MRLDALLAVPLLIAPSIIGLAGVPLFVVLLRRRGVKWAALVVVFLAVESTLAALWTVNTLGAGFGPGVWSFCMAPLMAIVALLIFLILGFSSFRAFGSDQVRRRFYLIGGLLVVALQLSPVAGYFALGDMCDAQSRQIAAQIIAAAEAYKQEHGYYPSSKELVPAYLPAWPSPACSWPQAEEPVLFLRGFFLMSDGSSFEITVPAASFNQIQIYDHVTRQWRYQKMLD